MNKSTGLQVVRDVLSRRDPSVRKIIFRWYFTKSALPWASPNGRRFREWILRLKDGDKVAECLFAAILLSMPDELSEDPDGIIAIPPSRSYPNYPLGNVAKIISDMRENISDFTDHLTRIHPLPKAVDDRSVRDITVQATSMRFAPLPSHVRSIVLIDDVATTWSTMDGALRHIKGTHPNLKVVCFAFGKTQRTGNTPFSEEP